MQLTAHKQAKAGSPTPTKPPPPAIPVSPKPTAPPKSVQNAQKKTSGAK